MPAPVPIAPQPDPTSADTGTLVDLGLIPDPDLDTPPDDGEQGAQP
jgi:hypothetical protein